MFDKQAVNEYQRITAPDSLKDRVMTAAKNRRKPTPLYLFPLAGSLVASLALILLATAMWTGTPSAEVTIASDGILLASQEAIAAEASPRTLSEHYALITLTADGDILIETDEVFMIGDEPLTAPYRTADAVTLRWNIPEDNTDTTLTVNGKAYRLVADLDRETVTILPIVQD